MNRRQSQAGFTLVEMLIVLFIIGVLLLIIMPNISDSGAKAQQKACQANINLLSAQVESYYLDHQHTYPPDIEALVPQYIKQVPVCPLHPDKNDAYTITETGEVKCKYHDDLNSKEDRGD